MTKSLIGDDTLGDWIVGDITGDLAEAPGCGPGEHQAAGHRAHCEGRTAGRADDHDDDARVLAAPMVRCNSDVRGRLRVHI